MGEPRLLLRYLFDSSFISEGTQGDPSLCELQSSNSDTILFKKSSQLWAWEETSGRILCPRNGLIFLFFKFFFFLVNIFTTFQMFQTWLALKQTLAPLAFPSSVAPPCPGLCAGLQVRGWPPPSASVGDGSPSPQALRLYLQL